MKVGDLVKTRKDIMGCSTRTRGIIIGFDEDNDPLVLWEKRTDVEANFRSHIVVVSRSQ
jgi:hypothetical protein